MQNIDQISLTTKKITFDKDSLPILSQAIRIAIYDEYKAYEFYSTVISKYTQVEPFSNIVQAEAKHIEALMMLCEKYEIEVPTNDIKGNLSVPNTIHECYEIGVAYEIENIYMYDYLLNYVSEYQDVVDTFYRLQAASYNNHLPTLRLHVANANKENLVEKFNEISTMANKIAQGEANQEDIIKMLGSTNISMLLGMLTGGVGGIALNQFLNPKED